MGVLLLSRDEEASELLCSALRRRQVPHRWTHDSIEAQRLIQEFQPLILVADSEVPGHQQLHQTFCESRPWTRCHVLLPLNAKPEVGEERQGRHKPFDAAEFAALLARECELADLERRRQNLELQADELALLVETSFEAIIGLANDGTVLSWNPGAERIYGYKASEIIGRNVDALFKRGEAMREVQAVEQARVHQRGHEVWVLVSRTPIDRSGLRTPLAFTEVSLDISAQHQLRKDLEHSQRLATLGTLSASVTHEINNPLSVIQNSADWLSEQLHSAEPECREAIEDIQVATRRVSSFVANINSYARKASNPPEAVLANEVLDLALRMTKPRAQRKDVEVKILPADPQLLLTADLTRLAQAWINLIANAVDAAAAGGRSILVSIEQRENYAILRVEDDGPGIDPDVADNLFEPFVTTKPLGSGTGLGLSVAKRIVEAHQGHIALFPRRGGGTCAEIHIPASVAAAAVEMPPATGTL